ncbi:MAG TPA: hypothetical protein VHN11_09315 [Xanthobacteraceae bacterium]|jgi:hypothetical protein|nr:hypothetical protein [Xanthobacteraceae bacterium]
MLPMGPVIASRPWLCATFAALHWHNAAMNSSRLGPKWLLLCLACVLLSACAGKGPGEQIADMPHWMGGEPEGVPPRRGTPEYEAWTAARAQEAGRPKTGNPK